MTQSDKSYIRFQLAAGRSAERAGVERLREAVKLARAHGWAWAEIAAAIGVTKQAAWERFRSK